MVNWDEPLIWRNRITNNVEEVFVVRYTKKQDNPNDSYVEIPFGLPVISSYPNDDYGYYVYNLDGTHINGLEPNIINAPKLEDIENYGLF